MPPSELNEKKASLNRGGIDRGRKSSNHFCVKQRLSRKHCKKDNWRYLYCKADSDPRVSRKNVVSSRWIIIPKRVEKVRESKYFISGLQFQHARNNSNFPKHTSSTWFTFFIIVIPLSSALTWTMKMQTSTIFYRKHELLFFFIVSAIFGDGNAQLFNSFLQFIQKKSSCNILHEWNERGGSHQLRNSQHFN